MTKPALEILSYKYEIAVDSIRWPWHADHGFSLSFNLFEHPKPAQTTMDISQAQSYFLNDHGDPVTVMSSLGYLLRSPNYAHSISDLFIIAADNGDRGLPVNNVQHLRLSPAGLYIGVFDVVLPHKDGAKKVARINSLVEP